MESIEKEFVPHDQALKLKKLGVYTIEGKQLIPCGNTDRIRPKTSHFLAPTFSQAFRWFREKHNINQTIAQDGSLAKDAIWAYTIITDLIHFNDGYFTYEEAELACLDKLIEIVESKQE